EDFTGEIQALFMGKTYLEFGKLLQPDSIVAVRGKLNDRDDGMSLHAYGVKTIDAVVQDDEQALTISVSDTRATLEIVDQLKEMLDRHRGESEVTLNLVTSAGIRVFELPQRVRVTPDLYGDLKGLLGPRCLLDA